jgi:predicted O-methyltransferase YrrM
MTSPERVYSLSHAVEYVVRAGIPGDVVECGVWKGGSSMALALALIRAGDTSRQMYLYDTFDEGWPAGGPDDVTVTGVTAHQLWLDAIKQGETADTLFAKYDNVFGVMKSTGYPLDQIHMVKGKVEDTIPGVIPGKIALLRLDTDWYASTKHELDHLYPLLSQGGVLMIDDYAAFRGARKAVDEYFEEHKIVMLLNRVDDGGYRIGIKR